MTAQQSNLTPPAPSPAIDGAPPVAPNLPSDADARAARGVSRNIFETLVFRGLSTPIALVLVVVQSRFLAPGGRGQFILVVLSVTILSRLFGQLGLAVTSRMQQHGMELRRLVHRAFALALLLGLGGGAAIVAWGHVQRGVGVDLAAIGAVALLPNIVWQSVSGVLLGLGRVRLWNWIQTLPPILTLAGMLVFVVAYDGGVRGALLAWALFEYVVGHPDEFFDGSSGEPVDRLALDFVAGMTDRYAINLYTKLFLPKPYQAT